MQPPLQGPRTHSRSRFARNEAGAQRERAAVEPPTLQRVTKIELAESALRLFVEINDWTWRTTPSVDEAEQAVLTVAAGTWSESDAAAWLRGYLVQRASR